jgi:hypothetical protein
MVYGNKRPPHAGSVVLRVALLPAELEALRARAAAKGESLAVYAARLLRKGMVQHGR